MQFTTEFWEKDFRKKLCRHLKEANDVVQPFEKIQLNSNVVCMLGVSPNLVSRWREVSGVFEDLKFKILAETASWADPGKHNFGLSLLKF